MSQTQKIGIGIIVAVIAFAIIFSLGTKTNAPTDTTQTSDEALRNEAAAIDQELEGLEGDRAMIDEGLETNVSAE